jgi:O-acetyl-ADP-ribose deacetylase (regulator of RNase III)
MRRCSADAALLRSSGGQLRAPYVIHAVGPVYRSRLASWPPLASAYAYALTLARFNNLRRIAFPAISCGVFGFPHDEGAHVAMRAVSQCSAGLAEVTFVLADRGALATWREAAARAGGDAA